jgi:hypothetical protein
MEKLYAISLFLGLILLGISCSNDFDLTTEWEDTPIVYGLLSRQDTAHYIKIQKAFLDPNASALDIAQIPDSLYYDDLDVKVEHVKSGKTYNLTMVDGNLEGYVKEEGIFADAPNYLYKFKLSDTEELIEGDSYQIKINRGDNKTEVIADDVIVSDMTIITPFDGAPIKILYRDFTVTWRSQDDARIFDLSLRFNYKENSLHPDSTNIYTDKSVVWGVKKNIARKEGTSLQTTYELPGESFYQFLGAELEANPDLNRFYTSIEFVVDAGGKEIFEYINIGQANTGITSSQVIPTYTNLSEGFGVFSSVNKLLTDPYFILHPEMRDSIEMGIYTADLNFQF